MTTYDPAGDHDPLFDLDPEAAAIGTLLGEHGRTKDKTVGTAYCPDHNGSTRTGLLRQGEHVVWRIHERVTHGGVRIQCRASGARLCDTGTANEAKGDQLPIPKCAHPLEGAA